MRLSNKHQNRVLQKIEEILKEKGLTDEPRDDCYTIPNTLGYFKIFKHHIMRSDQNVQVFMHKQNNSEFLEVIELDENHSRLIRDFINRQLDILNKPMIDKNNERIEVYLDLL